MSKIVINVMWDQEARVWVAINDELPIATESDTYEGLVKRIQDIVPEMAEANHVDISDIEIDIKEQFLMPNAETLEAMEEVINGRTSKAYYSIEELMKDLEADDDDDDESCESTTQKFEQFYGKPFNEITQDDLGDAEEIDWGGDVGAEQNRAWDPDFTKVTPEEARRLKEADEQIAKGEYYDEDEFWKSFDDSDPFYSKEHTQMLEKRINDMNAGKNVHEHELIEEEMTASVTDATFDNQAEALFDEYNEAFSNLAMKDLDEESDD